MVRKECFEKAQLFDENLRSVEDRDMWLRIAAHFQLVCLPSVLGNKRVHKHNISNDGELTLRSRIKVWEKTRRLFPKLTPVAILSNLHANTYLQLGYKLLAKDQRKEARKAGIKSLGYAARLLLKRKPPHDLLLPYSWFLGIALILCTLLGWQITQALMQGKNALFRKSKQQAA